MKTMPWFRFYSETADDVKFNFISRELDMPKYAVIGIWALLECRANQSPVRGALYVTALKRYSNGDIADELGIDLEFCNKVINAFVEMEMLEIRDGAIYLKNWDKRQYTSDNSTERVKKHREKHECNVTETLQGVDSSVSVSVSESVILNSDIEFKETPESKFLAQLDGLVGCPVGGRSDIETAEIMLEEFGIERMRRAASWIRDKGAVSMRSALRSMQTALRNGNFHDAKPVTPASQATDFEALADEMRL